MYKHREMGENAKLSARKTKISSFYFNKKKHKITLVGI